MSKKNKNRKEVIDKKPIIQNPFTLLAQEVKRGLWSILFFCLALILILASANQAGPSGRAIYFNLFKLFGLGYFLLPLILIIIAIYLLNNRGNNNVKNSLIFWGSILIILSVLGSIELVMPKRGGYLGRIASSVALPFGKIAGLIILISIFISGILITFQTPLSFSFLKKWLGKKQSSLEKVTVVAPEESKKGPVPQSILSNEEKEEESKVAPPKPTKPTKEIDMLSLKKLSNYKLPPLDLLDNEAGKPSVGDVRANANIIKRTLQNFGIDVEMGEISIGPTVTQYTLKPAEGVKLSRITSLSNDLSLALASHPIRIEAPIPGKSLVGIEVPNKAVALVKLRNLLNTEEFQKSNRNLLFPLGRDVSNKPFYVDITSMPHMLIAGATGSGKSVCIHSMLISLLFRNSPQMLRLILIDPKRVELSHYDGIPHLLTPVITDYKKVLPALRWAIQEMDRRYNLLLSNQSRDVVSYNEKILKNRNEQEKGVLPYIVIVIDELADLMMQYGKDIEAAIVRLAQMARATGIHLIISTQRPSVEVITGLIKANITSRVAFQVASQIDSRTILDCQGAEKLLGHGDLLYLAPETSKPKRLQGAFVSEEEVSRVVSFIRNEDIDISPDVSLENSLKENKNSDNASAIDLEEYSEEEDPLYDEALDVIKHFRKASASLLQRRLKIGYARAARLLDMLEERGVIGPVDGAKPREVYLPESEEEHFDE